MTAHATGFGSSLGWGRRPALLVVDMMQAYFTPGSPMCLPDRGAVQGCEAVLEVARTARIAIVHTRVAYAKGLGDGGVFVRKVPALSVLTEGSALGAFVPELSPQDGEVVVVKQYASAFFGTSLASTLHAARVDTVIIAGVSTSGCIRASATDAMQYGFVPLVVADACGDRDTTVHDANLFDLSAKYADLISVADVRSHLQLAD